MKMAGTYQGQPAIESKPPGTMADEAGDVKPNDAGDLTPESIADTGETPEQVKLEAAETKLAKVEGRRFDADNPPPEPEPTISLQGTLVATPGNLVVLAGQAKSAKSHAISALLAASMAPDTEGRDFLGFAAPNPEGKAVVYLDCEQSETQFHRLVAGALNRAGLEKPPPWLFAYTLTGLEPDAIRQTLKAVCDVARIRFGGVLYLAVDGFADLIQSPNDEIAAFGLVRELHEMALDLGAVIVGVIHHNAGQAESLKMRGHLGSQAERKAETVLSCKKDAAGAVTLYTTAARHSPISEANGSRFAWDDDAGRFASVASKAEAVNAEKAEERRKLVLDAFLDKPGLSHGELVERICELEAVSERTAKRRISELRAGGFVEVATVTGRYHKGGAS